MTFAKKSLGQNFLIDKNIVKKILNTVDFKNRNIIEIGPGKGSLTRDIIKKKPKSLLLIEKDEKLFEFLVNTFSKIDNQKIKIINQDILKFDFNKVQMEQYIILGNLPYNISSQILVKIIKVKKWPPKFTDIIFMFQKELGNKIIANNPSQNYGRISILANYRLNVIDKFFVSSNCFIPKPKVQSMVIHFKPKKNLKLKIKNLDNLEKVTNIFFSNKRKMINKSLKKVLNDKKIKSIPELDKKLRPENLNTDIFYKITKLMET